MIPFFLRFVALYCLLLVPWPALNQAACAYLRALGTTAYGGTNDRREIDFQPWSTPDYPYSVRVVIVNPALMKSDGSGPVRNLDLDARGLVLKPMAMIIALALCTPIPWKRRLKVLFWCVLWEQLLILIALGFCIWNESSEISLVTLTPFWKHLATGVQEFVVAQYGLSVPVLLWLVVAFRRGDERVLSI